jgi:hypothetical protein
MGESVREETKIEPVVQQKLDADTNQFQGKTKKSILLWLCIILAFLVFAGIIQFK